MSQILYDFIIIVFSLLYSVDLPILTHSVFRNNVSTVYRMSVSVLILVISYSILVMDYSIFTIDYLISPSRHTCRDPRTSTDNVCILPNVFSVHFFFKEDVFIYRSQLSRFFIYR
jgi:hypothetical protein